MRVATWNVNSIRARIDAVERWLAEHCPDVALLQETKCSDATFDTPELRGRLTALGYEIVHHGRDHYNGVAVLSRVGLDDVTVGFAEVDDDDPPAFGEARLVSATCGDVRMHCVYVPNGRKAYTSHWETKVAWLGRLRDEVDVSVPTILAGDVNVQRADIDVYDPRRWRNRNHATPEERAALAALIDLGLRDVLREHHPDPGLFTWWNHAAEQFTRNRGMRIDLVLCTDELADRVDDAWVDTVERGRPTSSDHAPVVVDFGRPAGRT